MSNNVITLSELVEKFKDLNTDFKDVTVSLKHVNVVTTTSAAELFNSKEDIDRVEIQEEDDELEKISPKLKEMYQRLGKTSDDNTLRVTFTQFKKMFGVGTKAAEGNQVPGCTYEPVKPGERFKHVRIDLSNPALEPFSDLIRNEVGKRKVSKVFYTLKEAMDKVDMTENMARRRLTRQPCVILINTKRKGRSIWPYKSVWAIGAEKY